jgi:hypothetical protein
MKEVLEMHADEMRHLEDVNGQQAAKLRETTMKNASLNERIRLGIVNEEKHTDGRKQVLEDENRALLIRVNQLRDEMKDKEK